MSMSAVEIRFLEACSRGASEKDLVNMLGRSRASVQRIRARLLKNLGARNTAHAVRRGFEIQALKGESHNEGKTGEADENPGEIRE